MPFRTTRHTLALAALGALMMAMPGAAAAAKEAAWIEVRTPHFIVSSDAGQKQARRVADQFEQIRGVFHAAFPSLRVDPGYPVLILAAKNEDSLKALLPGYWEVKGRVHPAGLYVSGAEKHYVALRVDATGKNPYHAIYHEYTHSLTDLNFRELPLWLSEGLAEFYGNTTVEEKEVRLGQFDEGHLLLLQQSRLLPIEELLRVDHNSPHYNEANRASVFYAESWAVVHYLMVEPDAVKAGYLRKFLAAYSATGDQNAAAAQAFGDLKLFIKRIDAYVHQTVFHYARIKSPAELHEKDVQVRPLPAAEATALRGDFYVQTGRFAEAKTTLEEAARLDPKLGAGHESLGYYYYRRNQFDEAAREFAEAARMDSHSFVALYFHALLSSRLGGFSPEKAAEIRASLQKAIQLNPNFAPAYAALSSFQLMRGGSRDQALASALRAGQLEPGGLHYAINLGQILLALNRIDEAEPLAAKITKAAKTPADVAMAAEFQNSVNNYKEYAGKVIVRPAEEEPGGADAEGPRKEGAAGETGMDEPRPALRKDRNIERRSTEKSPREEVRAAAPPAQPQNYSMVGRISEANCPSAGEILLTLTMSGLKMQLHAADAAKIGVTSGGKKTAVPANPCREWKGRTAQITYRMAPGTDYDGEMTQILFQ